MGIAVNIDQYPMSRVAGLQTGSVLEGIGRIVQWTCQKIMALYGLIMTQVRSYCLDGGFWLFRAAEIINPPTLMSRIELLWVYANRGWYRFWADKKEARLIEDNQELMRRNHALQESVRPLLIANAQVVRLSQECERLCKENGFLQQDRADILATRDAVLEEKRHLAQMVASLTTRPRHEDALAAIQSCLSEAQKKWLTQYMMNPVVQHP